MRYGPFFFEEDVYTGAGEQIHKKQAIIEDGQSAYAFQRLYRQEDIPDDGVELVLLPEQINRTYFDCPEEALLLEEPELPDDVHDDDPWIRELRSAIADRPIPSN